jgi:hypothetical protein
MVMNLRVLDNIATCKFSMSLPLAVAVSGAFSVL